MEETKIPSQKNRFLEIFIVLSILAVFYSVYLAPEYINHGYGATPERYAFGVVKSFATSAATFAANSDEQIYFKDGTRDFGDWSAHTSPKGGYIFTYFASEDCLKYLYFAIPATEENGEYAFLVDESNELYRAKVNQSIIEKFVQKDKNFASAEVDWTKEGEKRIKDIPFNLLP